MKDPLSGLEVEIHEAAGGFYIERSDGFCLRRIKNREPNSEIRHYLFWSSGFWLFPTRKEALEVFHKFSRRNHNWLREGF